MRMWRRERICLQKDCDEKKPVQHTGKYHKERMKKMSQELEKRTLEWKQLERKTEEQRKLADEYYESNLLELIVEEYVANNKAKVVEPVDYLVMSVGTSYEPIVLNIRLFQPKKVLLLCTRASAKLLEKIVAYCALKPDAYEKSMVSETNPLEIYREIKHAYLQWDKPEKMYIDFTGGTKAMSVAAAMAGAMINVQLVYVGTNEYLVDFRKPNPGSETLFYITNPLAVFGDLEIEKALILFTEHNYAGAKEKLSALKENIPDPNIRQELNFAYLLAKVYEEWDALEFIPAYEDILNLNAQLKRDAALNQNFLLMDFYETLKKQEQILCNLRQIPGLIKEHKNLQILQDKKLMISLMFTMCQNALIREEQEKYDMATLLLYRLLEMIGQRRLARYGLYVSKMAYANIKYDNLRRQEYKGLSASEQFALLKTNVKEIKNALYGRESSDYLPDQVSLLDSFILLQALGDPIVFSGKPEDVGKLKRIRAMVFLRNNSIFAHGLGSVSVEDFSKFKKFVLEMFQEFCRIEKVNYAEWLEQIHWLNPTDSRNYARGKEEF